MSSAHHDSGLPAPAQHEVPLSAEDASRLLDSIRQAEGELAATGEHIAVSPAAETAAAAALAAAPDAESAAVVAPESAEDPHGPRDGSSDESGSAAVESDNSGAAVAAESVAPSTESRADAAVAAVDHAESAVTESGTAAAGYVDPTPMFEAAVSAAEEFALPAQAATEATTPVSSFSSEIVVEVEPETAESADVAAEFAAADETAVAAPGTNGGLILPGDVASDVETIVHVMRHGEVHNPNGVLYGRLPGFQLSVTGRAQAQAVARSLADHDIALVVASPLQRAQETADPIAKGHRLIIRTDDNLIEAGNTFEGLRVSASDGALRKPRHWWKLRDPFTPSWGEPYLQIAHRMLAAVNKARVEAAGREAVLVSHQLPVWTLRRFLQGERLWHDPRHRQCSLASLTSLVYQGDTLIDIVYSEPAGASDPTVTGA